MARASKAEVPADGAFSANDYAPEGQPLLDNNQHNLLLAALASNQPPNNVFAGAPLGHRRAISYPQFPYTGPVGNLEVPQQDVSPDFGDLVDDIAFEESLGDEFAVDFENMDASNLTSGALEEYISPELGLELGEKRKLPEDAENADDSAKEKGGEQKIPKKPGRKLSTSEPTTKRKAQNRAAQRAFRERKEKHVKDLETKVNQLQEKSTAANHENGMLRVQISRLQTQLKEYRKRLSLSGPGLMQSTAYTDMRSFQNSSTGVDNLLPDFPRFGSLPGSHLPGEAAKAPKMASPDQAGQRGGALQALSPPSQGAGSNASPPNRVASSSTLTGAHGTSARPSLGPTAFRSVASPTNGRKDVPAAPSRVFQFNSGASTHSNSPSISSNSQVAQGTSCDTSPEPFLNSPGKLADTVAEGCVCHGDSEGEITFCEKLNMACGNPRDPVPRAVSLSDANPPQTAPQLPAADLNGFDIFVNQNGGQFDPLLFGDYRDTQTAVVGDGSFTGGLFNDAFPMDFGGPFRLDAGFDVPKPAPLSDEKKQRGNANQSEEVVPGEDTNSMLNCHAIWDKVTRRPDFKDGSIDIDHLCTELRTKARCSGSGVVVNDKDVDDVFKRLPAEQK